MHSLLSCGILPVEGGVDVITKFQCKILKKALRNKGFNTDGQRETDAARYLFEKKYLKRSRDEIGRAHV